MYLNVVSITAFTHFMYSSIDQIYVRAELVYIWPPTEHVGPPLRLNYIKREAEPIEIMLMRMLCT